MTESLKLPAGWYAVFLSREVSQAKPTALTRFGLPLVAWRDRIGGLKLMSDLCPHRGARLSQGRVDDDEIHCPFHGFRFDAAGTCTWIPEIKRGASGVCVTTHPVIERDGVVYMHWGAKGTDLGQPPEFKTLPAKTRRVGFEKIWNVHFTRSVENQLDYAHLPFVHRTSIGRLVKGEMNPILDLNHQHLMWHFGQPDKSHIEFLFPNLWHNKIAPKLSITLFFVPVDATHTKLYFTVYRGFLRTPPLAWLMDWLDRRLNLWILGQDERVVTRQLPWDSRAAKSEHLVASDKVIRAFREWLKSAS